MTAHRALPLSIVEARTREQRTAWTGCTQNCRQGRDCTCAPAAAPAEMTVYDPSDDDQGEPLPWRETVRFWVVTSTPAAVAFLGYFTLVWAAKP